MSVPVDTILNRLQASTPPPDDPCGTASVRPMLYPGLTPIIGRDEEIASIMRLLSRIETRLITLTGPAGVGKTRVAEEIVSRIGRENLFGDGLWFTPLQALRDAGLVLPVIASVIGLDRPIEGDVLSRLAAEIGERRMLLVLDNLEQVIESGPALGQLLAECPGLTVLVTSRRPLRLRAEQVLGIAPLALPALGPGVPLTDVEASPAVQSFLQFVRTRNSAFALTADNAAVIGAICHHLDGLPLALELAAARMDVLTPVALLGQLRARADVLGPGPVDLPVRQRRMHEAVAWSYDLLTESEQGWFRRLSVLEGSFDLLTVERIGAPGGVERESVLDVLTELVRASLVLPDGENSQPGSRFRMLETVRAFGLSLHIDSGEIDDVRRLSALHFLELIRAPESTFARETVEANSAGIRAALSWSWENPDHGLFCELIIALEPFWRRGGHLEETWFWMERAIDSARRHLLSIKDRVAILLGASTLARRRADFQVAEALAKEGLRDAEEVGDVSGMARALNGLGAIATQRSDYDRARKFYQAALERYRQDGDLSGEAVLLHNIALITLGEYDLDRAIRLWEEAIPVARRSESRVALIATLRNMGAVRLAQGRTDSAARLLGEALSLSKRERDSFQAVICHTSLSVVAIERGLPDQARLEGADALRMARELGEPAALVLALINQAGLEQGRGELERADTLLIEAHEIASGIGVPLVYQPVLQAMGDLRRQQGEWRGAFDLYEESLRCWQQGGDMLDLVPLLVPFADVASKVGQDALARRILDVVHGLLSLGLTIPNAHQEFYRSLCLLHGQCPTAGQRAPLTGRELKDRVEGIFVDPAPPPLLSDRERAVLRLLADGYTNAQMAERLFVSPHTVNTHVRRIYQKMGVNSRSAATRLAVEQGMVAEP